MQQISGIQATDIHCEGSSEEVKKISNQSSDRVHFNNSDAKKSVKKTQKARARGEQDVELDTALCRG